MARIRTVKPEFFTSETVTALPLRARLTFIGAWTYVDDEGRGRDDARLIKAAVWPLDDDVTAADVADDQDELDKHGLIERYTSDDRSYFRVVGWAEHQRINRPTPSKLPHAPSEPCSCEHSCTTHARLSESSRQEREQGSGSGSGKEHDRGGVSDHGTLVPATVAAAKPPAPRKRNETWDALVELLGYQPEAKTECSNFGRVVKELAAVGATPDEIRRRGDNWKRTFPNARLTVNVLPKWWAALDTPANGTVPRSWEAIARTLGANA